MTYTRFALMIATSTIVMFGLMYLNTYAFEHVFYSETRAWMALLMGAVMAFVMMGFMAAMYPSRTINIAIFIGSVIVAALSLFLVRSQVTVQDESYMRAMIPHHSIAIMTSKRAGIEDARVRKMADGIYRAQQKEIAEMRALIADLEDGAPQAAVYQDPEPGVGTVQDAMNNTLLAGLDPAPMTSDEAGQVITGGPTCDFRLTRTSDPVLVVADGNNQAVMKLNGVILPLDQQSGQNWTAEGLSMQVSPVEDDWRSNARLTFTLTPGPKAAFRGFWSC